MSLLDVRSVGKSFGGLKAVQDMSLTLARGEVVGLFGPNGAGKTTLFNLIAGALIPNRGRVELEGRNVTRLAAHRRAQLGLARTFQVVQPLTNLSVADNLLVPLAHRALNRLLPMRGHRHGDRMQRVATLLEKVGLTDQAETSAGKLPLGMKKRLELARVMALEPRVLLLDEPLAGLPQVDAQQLLAVVEDIRHGMGVILVEHNVRLAMAACHRAIVMDAGEVISAGTPEAVRRDPKVIEAYLGHEEDEEAADA